jgi:enoyl-CoA hydratase
MRVAERTGPSHGHGLTKCAHFAESATIGRFGHADAACAGSRRRGLLRAMMPIAELMHEAMKSAAKKRSANCCCRSRWRPRNRGAAFVTTVAEGVRFERCLFHSGISTEDQKEEMAAFIQKRKHSFKNR